MASSFSLHRILVPLAAVTLVGACSGSDRVPPVAISGVPQGTRGELLLEGRVRDVDLARRNGTYQEPIAYAAPAANANGGSAGIDYLNTPNLAGTGSGAALVERQGARVIDGADLSETSAMAEPAGMGATVASGSPESGAGGNLVIPEGGVSMDAELGVAAVDGGSQVQMTGQDMALGEQQVEGVQPQIVTSGGAMAIAEGNTSQPVVDGIGFDNPTSVDTGQPPPQSDVAEIGEVATPAADDGILPLAEDNGNSGMDAKPAVDCSLYLDKRNCPQG